ncbi:MAG: hypothetical protein WBQ17_05450 [Rhizomicrobium sp.]
MQISANNLLQAAQQAFAPKPATRPPAAQAFEPLDFTPTQKPAAPPSQNGFQRPGSQVDIRV